jgi:hypothetical protein
MLNYQRVTINDQLVVYPLIFFVDKSSMYGWLYWCHGQKMVNTGMVIHPIPWEAEPMCIRIPIDKMLAMPRKHMSQWKLPQQ